MKNIKYVLVSVSDKNNLIPFIKFLKKKNDISIIATGGTATYLNKNNIDVIEVSEYTGFPEVMDGRVKTLHPKIYAGLLYRKQIDENVLKNHNIFKIDLLIANLYPFDKAIDYKLDFNHMLDYIDIGGPCMLRAAAKNFENVLPVCDPNDYKKIINILNANNEISYKVKLEFAYKVFSHISSYDSMITHYFSGSINNSDENSKFPQMLNLKFSKYKDIQYGENPHQKSAVYVKENSTAGNRILNSSQIQGKELSYNNILDAEIALQIIEQFNDIICVIIKHQNPCGISAAENALNAYKNAFNADPTSAFGGIISFNCAIDDKTAKLIIDNQFVELIIAKSFSESAKKIFASKPNLRIIEIPNIGLKNTSQSFDFKQIENGVLIQDNPILDTKDLNNFLIPTVKKPTYQEKEDLLFSWKVIQFIKSNAILYTRNKMSLGIGIGQTSRISSVEIGIKNAIKNGLSLTNAVMASDAFFPFKDSIEIAARNKISAIIQPGGSVRDKEIIEAANDYNISMILTGTRCFKH